MKKTIKLLDLDCGHCADKIQNHLLTQEVDGYAGHTVDLLHGVLAEAKALIKQIEPDVTVKA